MWSAGVILGGVVAVLTIFIIHWTYKWKNPKGSSNGGVLPPGSMGWPLIGETLHLLIPSRSLDLHPFIKKRIQRYGPLFRTSLAGRSVIVSTDTKVNHYLILQEGRSVEMWYMDSFAKLFKQDGGSNPNAFGPTHRYIRSIVLSYFGPDSLREKLLPQIEQMVDSTLGIWSRQGSVSVKEATATMVFDCTAKQMIGYDPKKSPDKIVAKFTSMLQGFMSFPLNIPGTAFHRCLKTKKEMIKMIRNKLREKRDSPDQAFGGDLLDQAVKEMGTEKFLTEDFIVHFIFGALFASFDSISSAITLAFKLLTENPSVVDELRELDSNVISQNFTPFGGGMRQCAGAEFAKAFMATFFHVLVTKYRWTKIKGGGNVGRTPVLDFGDGIHIKVSEIA
ncbi:cytochrome P450, family 702, subfamily A, polypeptide 6 [Actinidia rufa]|uniref:Cytochrome P450, family 702, subfamily A, polypeptide 6 n=1 Tax=Actinidia rufa TaxID=165716 RepID=A0A7J0EJF1_9ERIC|nr:cytochrome P450, family 702, subfamily A, polypeptide 6 [Actinidia rufa]